MWVRASFSSSVVLIASCPQTGKAYANMKTHKASYPTQNETGTMPISEHDDPDVGPKPNPDRNMGGFQADMVPYPTQSETGAIPTSECDDSNSDHCNEDGPGLKLDENVDGSQASMDMKEGLDSLI